MVNRYIRVIKKILTGENPLEVSLPQSHWDRQFEKGIWDFLLEAPPNVREIARYVAEYANGRKIHVLDVGCGNGIIPRLLEEANVSFEYTGTDISEAALKQAQQQYPEGRFIHAGMEEELPIDDIFDIVLFSEVLLYGDSRRSITVHRKHCNDRTLVIVSLYKNWRTAIIWLLIRSAVLFEYSAYLEDPKSNRAWNVKVGKMK